MSHSARVSKPFGSVIIGGLPLSHQVLQSINEAKTEEPLKTGDDHEETQTHEEPTECCLHLEKHSVVQGDDDDQVTVDGQAGFIATKFLETPAGETTSLTVHNSSVSSGSVILCSQFYSGTLGTGGSPVVSLNKAQDGKFTINIHNAHPSAALSGHVKVHFLVI